METGAITGYFDVAQIVLYAFWIFFFGLILYLHRENKREGYPLESDRSKHIKVVGFPDMPPPKEYLLPHGGGTRQIPRPDPEPYPLAAKPVAGWLGAPLHPSGNPMVDGVGPAAYAIRPEVPDLTHDGVPKIVPMRVATDFSVEPRDPDPRGKPVMGADGAVGARVVDIWVDRAEPQIRYLEIEVASERKAPHEDDDAPETRVATHRTLLPINFVRISKDGQRVKVVSIKSNQFAWAPGLAKPDQVTLQEEDKICAFYGGGHLYAMPSRTEPWL
jgi:photosynthetic reaction center H subunit